MRLKIYTVLLGRKYHARSPNDIIYTQLCRHQACTLFSNIPGRRRETARQLLAKSSDKQLRRIAHVLDNSPETRMLNVLQELVTKRKFTINMLPNQNIELIKNADHEKITVTYNTFSNERVGYDEDTEMLPFEFFDVQIQPLLPQSAARDVVLFRCLYSPNFEIISTHIIPQGCSSTDGAIYDGRDSDDIPSPLKVSKIPQKYLVEYLFMSSMLG